MEESRLFAFRVKLCFRGRVIAPVGVHVARNVGQLLGVVDPPIDRDRRRELGEPAELLVARFRQTRLELVGVSVVRELGAAPDVVEILPIDRVGAVRRVPIQQLSVHEVMVPWKKAC